MPLLGHLFSGLAAGAISGARHERPPLAISRRFARDYLLPLSVAGAYLPDILSQTLLAAGYADGQHLGHSLPSAFLLTIFWAFLMNVGGLSPKAATAVSAAGVLSHIALDALQSSNHLPSGIIGEAIIAVAACAVWLGLCRSPLRPIPAALVILIGAAAVGVFVLREARERDLERARQFIEAGRAEEGFALLDAADRWPAVAKPGRVDYYRGVGLLEQGRRAEAEASFLKAYRADPRYLWVVFDLADFYAGSPLPLEQRRGLAEPFMRSLAEDFPGRPEALRGLEKARKMLEQ